jgi:GNAT superfamily N-acetyltransferase
MAVPPNGYRLRDLAPGDGPAITRLFAASPDTGLVRFRPEYCIDPYQAMTYGGDEVGVVAERDDGSDGVAGFGMVRFGEAVLRGTERRYALMHSLVVHPHARRQGLAGAIIGWRLDRIRAELGEEAVVVAMIQKSNTGSFAGASRWATQFTEPIDGIGLGLRADAPSVPDGVTIRPGVPGDHEAFAAGYATTHVEHDLWPAIDARRLAGWLARTPIPGTPIHDLWVAEDAGGNLLAGVATTEARRVSVLQVDAMPRSMRLVNALIHVVPAGGRVEQVALDWMWMRAGSEGAAHALFETVRWWARDRGNMVFASFDRRGPLRRMVDAPFWMPQTQFSMAIRSPEPIRPDRLIESVQT